MGREFGLLANGSSRCWDVAVDEAFDKDEWFLQIEGPRTSLNFQLQDLSVLPQCLEFLNSCTASRWTQTQTDNSKERTLRLGQFGSAPVELIMDREEFPRCFIVMGEADCALSISLWAEDIQMLCQALEQVVSDLSESAG